MGKRGARKVQQGEMWDKKVLIRGKRFMKGANMKRAPGKKFHKRGVGRSLSAPYVPDNSS